MIMAIKLPKQVFIIWEENADKPFLSPATNINDLKCPDSEVGIYELKKIRRFKLIEVK
jgi:hypothetical protein